MFCSSCGENCPLEAKYCHKCGDHLKQNVTKPEASVDEGSKKNISGSSASGPCSGSGVSALLTYFTPTIQVPAEVWSVGNIGPPPKLL